MGKLKESRAPHGARGLKHLDVLAESRSSASRPTRGAWIETLLLRGNTTSPRSRPTRGAWIETSG